MKSDEVSGEANRRIRNDVVLSLAISMPENRDRNDRPKTAIPGTRLSILNRSIGILDWMAESRSSTTRGNPMPKARFKGSLSSSLRLREANIINFIPVSPILLPGQRRRLRSLPRRRRKSILLLFRAPAVCPSP